MLTLSPFTKNELQKKDSHEFVDFYNMLEDFFNGNIMGGKGLKVDTFKLDVKDQGDSYLVEAEMPGIKKEEIELDYQDGHLIIQVSQNQETKEEKGDYIHRERRSTAMQRSIFLQDVNIEKIDAKLEEGVLKISLPKKEPASKKLPISIK